MGGIKKKYWGEVMKKKKEEKERVKKGMMEVGEEG